MLINEIIQKFIFWIKYVLAYQIKAFLYFPVTFIKRVILGKEDYWRKFFFERWGWIDKKSICNFNMDKKILIDALGVGEVKQIKQFCELIKSEFSQAKIIIFTNNVDSYKLAEEYVCVDCVLNSGWDINFVAERFLTRVKPTLFISIENAHFPIFLKKAQELNIPTVLCSGFFPTGWDKNSFMKRSFFLQFYKYLDYIFVKGESDFTNFRNYVKENSNLKILGDLKYDSCVELLDENASVNLKHKLGFTDNDYIIVAGSVHAYEFPFLLKSFKLIEKIWGRTKLVIAPRWLKDTDILIRVCSEYNFIFKLRTSSKDCDFNILILNTFGELKDIYSIADIVFIGGSLIKESSVNESKGWNGLCHNIIEPLLYKKPILFGSNNVFRKEILDSFLSIGKFLQVDNSMDFFNAVKVIKSNRRINEKISNVCMSLIADNKNPSVKHLRAIKHIMVNERN